MTHRTVAPVFTLLLLCLCWPARSQTAPQTNEPPADPPKTKPGPPTPPAIEQAAPDAPRTGLGYDAQNKRKTQQDSHRAHRAEIE
jgi:hypothetical protein